MNIKKEMEAQRKILRGLKRQALEEALTNGRTKKYRKLFKRIERGEQIMEELCETYILPKDKSDLIYDATYRAEIFSNLFLAGRNYFNQAKNALERFLQDAE